MPLADEHPLPNADVDMTGAGNDDAGAGCVSQAPWEATQGGDANPRLCGQDRWLRALCGILFEGSGSALVVSKALVAARTGAFDEP